MRRFLTEHKQRRGKIDRRRVALALLVAPAAFALPFLGLMAWEWIVNGPSDDPYGPLFGLSIVVVFGPILAYPWFIFFGYPVCMYLRSNGFSSYSLHALLGAISGLFVYFLLVFVDVFALPRGDQLLILLGFIATPAASTFVVFRLIGGRPVHVARRRPEDGGA